MTIGTAVVGSGKLKQRRRRSTGIVGPNSLVYDPASSHPLVDFTNDSSGNVWIDYWSGTSWVWQNLGCPGVAVYNSDALYVPNGHPLVDFVQGSDGNLYDIYWSGSSWVWESQGHPPGTGVEWPVGGAVYQPTTKSLMVFVTAANGHLFDKAWIGSSWVWQDLGTPPGTLAQSQPSAIIETLAPQAVKAYVTGANGHLFEYHGSWNDLGTPPGTTVNGAPAAVYQPTAHPFTVFVVGADGHLHDAYYNSSTWTWQDQGTPPGDTAVSATKGLSPIYGPTPVGLNLMVFTTGLGTGNLYIKFWDGSLGWQWGNLGKP